MATIYLRIRFSQMRTQTNAEVKRLDAQSQRVPNIPSQPPLILRYGVAVLSVAAAVISTLWLRMELGQSSTPIVATFLCAVMFSAWFGGVRPGVLAIAFSLLAFDYYFVSPLYSFGLEIKEIPRLLVFALSAIFIGSLSAAQRSKSESLKLARDILNETIQELKQTNQALRTENSERERVEEELRERAADLTEAQRVGKFGNWILNLRTNTIRWSEQLYRMFEIEQKDFDGRYESFVARIHPEDRSLVLRTNAQTRSEGSPFDIEYRILTSNDELRIVREVGYASRDEAGHICRLFGTAQDITDRKLIEWELDERLRFETLLSELSAAFANLSPHEVDREIDKWLQRLVEFLGVDRASFLQFAEDWTMLFRSHSYTIPGIEPLPPPPIELKNQFPWITDQLRRGLTVKWSRVPDDMPEEAAKEKEYAARLGVKSGLNIPVRVGGTVICAVTFTSILTYRDWPDVMVGRLRLVGEIFAAAVERKRAEEELRKEKEILEKIFDNIPVLIGFVGHDGRVRLVNNEWERVMGWTLKELRDQNVDIFAEAYPVLQYRQKVLDFVAAATGEWVDLKIRVRDGRLIDAACAIVQLSDGTKVAIAQDITERKRAEERIRATTEQLRALPAKLQSAKEEEDIRIAREIHDEMGSSLTSLRWELERMDRSISDSEDGSRRQELRTKIADMMRLTDVTISTMRRIASELRPSVLDDLGWPEAIEWQAQQFQTRTGIVCSCDCSLEDIEFDPDQSTAIFRIFQEALTNVLSHAGATRVDVMTRSDDGEFVLTISDNGRGITEDEKLASLSLGIVGMRERAHLVRGELEISGTQGKGTVVALRVPITKEASGRAQHLSA